MNRSRIKAVMLRHAYLMPKSVDRLTDLLLWPLFDIFIMGLTTKYLVAASGKQSVMITAVLTGVLFWRTVWQSNYEVGLNVLEEAWNKNLGNLLATPLSIKEWLFANCCVGLSKLTIVLAMMSLEIVLMYKGDFFIVPLQIIPYFLLLILFGWSVGFVGCAIVLRYGLTAQSFTWTLPFIVSPFCAAYYPISSLPVWAQHVSLLLPASYSFEAMRSILLHGEIPSDYLWKAICLSCIYLPASIALCGYAFQQARKRGFDNLE